MYPAIFLDRDGVIIENREHYVRSWADVTFLPGVFPTLSRLAASPYKIIIVTNQSAVGRGIISIDTAHEINRRVVEEIQSHGGAIDGVFICPHAPTENCDCRKPKPGLLYQAAQALDIDLAHSWIVGDAVSDIFAGQNAGLERAFLVRTGRGAAQAVTPEAALLQPFIICDTLTDILVYL